MALHDDTGCVAQCCRAMPHARGKRRTRRLDERASRVGILSRGGTTKTRRKVPTGRRPIKLPPRSPRSPRSYSSGDRRVCPAYDVDSADEGRTCVRPQTTIGHDEGKKKCTVNAALPIRIGRPHPQCAGLQCRRDGGAYGCGNAKLTEAKASAAPVKRSAGMHAGTPYLRQRHRDKSGGPSI